MRQDPNNAGPDVGFGSGFLLESGIVATNAHVVATCTEKTLIGISTANTRVRFSRVISDKVRDLALLVPAEKLTGGFRLAPQDSPEPGTIVSTWGYPFGYNSTSPLLSVGYVSGYRADNSSGKPVKHIVVNGAFNHGNSGGPLLIARGNQVIGIVVLTFHFYPPEVKQLIDVLSGQKSGIIAATTTMPDGRKDYLSEAQVTGMLLNEFYQKTQLDQS
jgi:S1-C subfamily serine protease